MRPLSLLLITAVLLVPGLLLAQQEGDTTDIPADTTRAEQIINDIKDSKLSKRIVQSQSRS